MHNKKLELKANRKKELMPLNLQFFAADGGDGDGGKDGSGAEVVSFDDFLKQEGNQAEFDRRVQKAVNTAVNNAQEKWKILTDDKVSEADRLAKMTAQEKREYLNEKKEKELAAREAEMNKKELMAEAKNTLTEKKLPLGLAEVLDYSDADACNKSITAIEKAFQEAVKTAVEERLKGDAPPRKASASDDAGSDSSGFVSIIKENQSKR
jgi:hypothetical protein